MIWLGLDTANAPLSVALVRDGELLVELNSGMGLNHSAGAMPAVEQLFKRAGIRWMSDKAEPPSCPGGRADHGLRE